MNKNITYHYIKFILLWIIIEFALSVNATTWDDIVQAAQDYEQCTLCKVGTVLVVGFTLVFACIIVFLIFSFGKVIYDQTSSILAKRKKVMPDDLLL